MGKVLLLLGPDGNLIRQLGLFPVIQKWPEKMARLVAKIIKHELCPLLLCFPALAYISPTYIYIKYYSKMTKTFYSPLSAFHFIGAVDNKEGIKHALSPPFYLLPSHTPVGLPRLPPQPNLRFANVIVLLIFILLFHCCHYQILRHICSHCD